MKNIYKLNLYWEDEDVTCSLVEMQNGREIVLASKEKELIEGVIIEDDILDFSETIYGQLDMDMSNKLLQDEIFKDSSLCDEEIYENNLAWSEFNRSIPQYISQIQKGEDVTLVWNNGSSEARVPYASIEAEVVLWFAIRKVCDLVQEVMEEAEIIASELTEVNLSGQWAESVFVKKRLSKYLSIPIDLSNSSCGNEERKDQGVSVVFN